MILKVGDWAPTALKILPLLERVIGALNPASRAGYIVRYNAPVSAYLTRGILDVYNSLFDNTPAE